MIKTTLCKLATKKIIPFLIQKSSRKTSCEPCENLQNYADVSEKCTILISLFDFTKQNIMGAIFTNFECICFEWTVETEFFVYFFNFSNFALLPSGFLFIVCDCPRICWWTKVFFFVHMDPFDRNYHPNKANFQVALTSLSAWSIN